MDYNKFCSLLLQRIFSDSVVISTEEFIARLPPESAEFASGGLNKGERERIRWGFWATALVTCIVALGDASPYFEFDHDRICELIRLGYPRYMRDDGVRIQVKEYLRDPVDLKALKRSRAVPCAFYQRLEEQIITRGKLAAALSAHRITKFMEAYVEGCRISPLVDRARVDSGEATGPFAEMLSGGMTNQTKDGVSRAAMVFTGMILDSGVFRNDQKSLRASELVLELVLESYKEFRSDISEHTVSKE